MADNKRRRICVELDEETNDLIQKYIEILKKERVGTKVTVSDVVRYAIHALNKKNSEEE